MQPARCDADLIEAAWDGDKAAFAELVGRHYPLLLAVCRRAIGDSALAEDAAQEAVLQALLGLVRLKRPDRFGSWLVAIGLNMCRRQMRQRSRDAWTWEAVLGGRLVDGAVEQRPGPHELAEAAELRRLVRRAVSALPPGQRDAVLHFYLAELTLAETAALLGIEVGAVKTRLHKARRSLKRQLQASLMEDDMEKKISRRTVNTAAGAIAAAAVGKLSPANATEGKTMVEMHLRDVRRYRADDDAEYKHVCLLEEVDGERMLPIWIGEFEATSLALLLERVATPRPMAYAFAAGLLDASGGRLHEVRISRLEDEVFYAEAVVEGPDGLATVDARPSDALNLAQLAGVPVRVDAAVLAAPAPKEARPTDGADGAAEIVASATAKWVVPPPER